MTDVVTIRLRDEQQAAVWRLAREVSVLLVGLPWVLVGGLMVQLHEAQAGRTTAFATTDVDVVADVRTQPEALHDATRRLLASRFSPEVHGELLTYRFRRGLDVVDLLAPDHLGDRADITTVPPGQTFQAVGARQAINRSRILTVDAGEGSFDLPVPSLVAAIVIKAQVIESSGPGPNGRKHERDLARLLALVTDPISQRAELTRKERGYVRGQAALLDTSHRAWIGIAGAADAGTALRILSDIEA